MARVAHVKAARQRYATVPVLNDDGTPKRVPVMRRDGTQKVTKHGKAVTMVVTREDRTKPLDPERCDFPGCGQPILPGQPYQWVKPKSGPYGGRKRSRHAEHPAWKVWDLVWDLSNSLSARIAQVQSDGEDAVGQANDADEVKAAMEEAANAVRDLAEEKREAAGNIVDGFGHDTEQSQDLEQQAEDLEQQAEDLDAWADDLEGWEPDGEAPDQCEECNAAGTVQCPAGCSEGQVDCEDCHGDGEALKGAGPCPTCDGGGQITCDDCDGEGQVECEDCGGSGDPDEGAVEDWLDGARDSATEALGKSPL